MGETMNWETYKNYYHNFMIAINSTRLISYITAHTADDFPINLPELLVNEFQNGQAKLHEHLSKSGFEKHPSGASIIRPDEIGSITGSQLWRYMMYSALARGGLGEDPKDAFKIDSELLTKFTYSQELVLLIAHLEHFLSESVRALLKARPERLKSSKTITWEEVVSASNLDDLINAMVDKFIYEEGMKPLASRIKWFIETHHVFEANERIGETLHTLSIAEQIRHIIMHNGGKISSKFLKKTKEISENYKQPIPYENLCVDEEFPVHEFHPEGIFHAVRDIAGSICIGIAKKEFAVEEKYLHFVFQPILPKQTN